MPLLQPGEEHDLGFGIDDQVKVKHAVLEEKRGESGLISTSHVDSRNFRVNVKNLHERPIDVTILDRIPVSQNDEIKVEYTGRASPTTQNVDDKRGIIAFAAASSSPTRKRCSNTVIEFPGLRRSRSSTGPESGLAVLRASVINWRY